MHGRSGARQTPGWCVAGQWATSSGGRRNSAASIMLKRSTGSTLYEGAKNRLADAVDRVAEIRIHPAVHHFPPVDHAPPKAVLLDQPAQFHVLGDMVRHRGVPADAPVGVVAEKEKLADGDGEGG